MAVTKEVDSTNGKAKEGTRIKWDDSQMKSAYANVCNVTSTREEVVMLFSVNQAWNRGQNEVTIQLTDRIIVSPYAAKRLAMLLDSVVKEYEKRFGTLNASMCRWRKPAREGLHNSLPIACRQWGRRRVVSLLAIDSPAVRHLRPSSDYQVPKYRRNAQSLH